MNEVKKPSRLFVFADQGQFYNVGVMGYSGSTVYAISPMEINYPGIINCNFTRPNVLYRGSDIVTESSIPGVWRGSGADSQRPHDSGQRGT